MILVYRQGVSGRDGKCGDCRRREALARDLENVRAGAKLPHGIHADQQTAKEQLDL